MKELKTIDQLSEKEKISLDDLNTITVNVMETLEEGFAEHGIKINNAELDKICDFIDDLFFKYTNGSYDNYN